MTIINLHKLSNIHKQSTSTISKNKKLNQSQSTKQTKPQTQRQEKYIKSKNAPRPQQYILKRTKQKTTLLHC